MKANNKGQWCPRFRLGKFGMVTCTILSMAAVASATNISADTVDRFCLLQLAPRQQERVAGDEGLQQQLHEAAAAELRKLLAAS